MARAGAKGHRATHWRLTTMRYICAQTMKPPTPTEAVTRERRQRMHEANEPSSTPKRPESSPSSWTAAAGRSQDTDRGIPLVGPPSGGRRGWLPGALAVDAQGVRGSTSKGAALLCFQLLSPARSTRYADQEGDGCEVPTVRLVVIRALRELVSAYRGASRPPLGRTSSWSCGRANGKIVDDYG